MKFTEEQYQKIVEAYQSKTLILDGNRAVSNTLKKFDCFIGLDKALAIANPLTREWAHDKFVEKEKKYYWTNKKGIKVGLYEMDGLIFLKERYWAPLTESEIKAWGYNPEMFDREEL